MNIAQIEEEYKVKEEEEEDYTSRCVTDGLGIKGRVRSDEDVAAWRGRERALQSGDKLRLGFSASVV